MLEIKARTHVVTRVLECHKNHSSLTGYRESDIELCFLQIRKCLELIMYSSVVAHYHVGLDLQRRILNGEWNATKILKYIRTANPDFFPAALERKPSEDGGPDEMIEVSGALTENEFRQLYDRLCGPYLHASRASAFDGKHDELFESIETWHRKIITLLNHYWIKVTKDDALAVVMHTKDVGDVQVVHMAAI